MTGVDLVLVVGAVAVAPVLARLVGRVIELPLIVVELLLGVLIGPAVLGWVDPSQLLDFLAEFGVVMLFFLAGYEIDFGRIRGRPLRRSVLGWLLSLVLGVGGALLLAPDPATGVFVGIALTSTALGALVPIMRDAGLLGAPFGSAVMAVGAVGEFGPLVAIALFLSGRNPGTAAVVLIGFVVLAAAAILLAARGTHLRLHRLIAATLDTSGQFAVRIVLFVVAVLVAVSMVLGLDLLIGAFTAGVLVKIIFNGAPLDHVHRVESKLDAVGFGFLVPLFFLNTGLTFDLRALLADGGAMLLVPGLLVALLLVRGLPALLSAPVGSSPGDRGALVLLGATGLPIVIAVTQMGLDEQVLTPSLAAALVAAGLLSVLIYPLAGLALRRRLAGSRSTTAAQPASPESPGDAAGQPPVGR
ncbi:cation:proton antiporter [Nakamurella sp. YIM 132084]|uniref:Cation:proton antiporter n=1 Tax=Nakamurella leprariae TaxID=2803911 RepID=A0A938Y516_9ACTN|nr:cation:proton antiporter [Nakamurella leprariae]MBM9466186.1 cation:proton antiporter [Nakamurella leprariae]